jgi:hypothetical protein
LDVEQSRERAARLRVVGALPVVLERLIKKLETREVFGLFRRARTSYFSRNPPPTISI